MKRDPTGFNDTARKQMLKLKCNFSTSAELIHKADRQKLSLCFSARTEKEWAVWRRRLLQQIRKALGRTITPPSPSPRIVECVRLKDHLRYKIVYRTTSDMWVPAYLLIPASLKRGKKAPGVLAIHGHGYGAVDLVGLSPEEQSGGNAHHNYALDAVRRGFVVLAPELRGFGQRAVDEDQLAVLLRKRNDPEQAFFKRDMCNVQHLKASLLGYTFMGLQLHDLTVGLSVLAARPEVLPARIGACGLSTGGMMTLFLTALDTRIKAAVISGTLTSYRSYAFRIETTCGSQLPHGLFAHADLADVAALIAPRPVCFESGREDFGFLCTEAHKAFQRVKRCYQVLGVGERAVLDAFDGGHEWHGAVGMPMMERWLTR